MRKILFALIVLGLTVVKAHAQLSTNPDKFLGNITTSYQIDYGNEKFYTLWNQITPENESKWDQIEGGKRGSFSWSNCDRIYNYAKQHKFPFKFHTLVWGSQYPKWMDNLSMEQQYAAIVEWMDAVKKRYPDLQMIDVVNEAVAGHAPAPYKEALGGDGITGYDWIIKAFEMAYERWPNAILIYNDYNTFQWNTDQFIELVRTLRDAGAPIDAYGCQSHDLTGCSASTLQTSMNKIQNALKMPMYITEYDIASNDDNAQLRDYKAQFPLLWEADYCAGVTLWGYIYGKTWTGNAEDGTQGNSGLIKDGKDRPAMTWLRDYMKTDKAQQAKSPFPGMTKEASIYVKPATLGGTKGEPVEITVRAKMKTKTIEKVDLYVGSTLISTMTETPYTAQYTPANKGTYTLKAVVTATDGTKYERLSRYTAFNERKPYKGGTTLPGTLQFENFDEGGEGLTYHDTDTKNEGGVSYRTDAPGVDIVTGNGGYALGYTAAGEWLEYTVNVTEAGIYSYEAYVSSGLSGSGFSVSLKGDYGFTELCKVSVPQTGNNNWDSYRAVKGNFNIPLEAGQHILRVTINGSNCNLDKIVLKRTSDEEGEEKVDPNFHIYLCFGQSNMEGNAQPEAIDMTADERFQMLATCNFDNPARSLGQWYTATPPIVSPAGGLGISDYFGRTMVENLPDAKVGVIAVAMGGSPIEMFDKDKYAQKMADNPNEWWATLAKRYYGGNPYQRIIDMAKKAQKVGVIKGILLHQGCSNCGDPNWPTMVKKIYEDMLADLNLKAEDVPLFVGETERADMGGGCSYHNTQVARMPQVIPTSYVISSEKIPGNGKDAWHFSAAGYRMFGKRYAIAALHLMGIDIEDDTTQGEDASTLIPGEAYTSIASLEGQTFAIVNENMRYALYGSDNQNLGYDGYATAFASTNTGYLFKAEGVTVNGKKYYLLRLITPMGNEYEIWGNPGYLNTQAADGWCSFILGLNNQNGQDIKNGAVWDIQYVEGKGFTLKNIATELYLIGNGPANGETPVYWNLCKLKMGSTAIQQVTDSRPAENVYYDLYGRRVAKPGKGLYIVNGRKVFLK